MARAFPCCSSSLFSLADMCSLPVVSRGYEARPPSTYHHTVLAPLAPHPPTDSGPRRPLRPLMGLHPSGWDSKRVPQQHAPQTQMGPFQVEMCPGTPPKCPRGVVLNMLYCFIMVTFWKPFWYMLFLIVFAQSFRKMNENGVSKGAKSDVLVQPTITPTMTPNNYHSV